MTKDKFLRMIVPIAQRQAEKHNNQIYASVCIAQAIHESGWGTSAKMVKANALFGIKVGNSAWHFGTAWKDKAYKTGTTEYYDGKTATKIVDWFRAYDSIEDATEDYFDMLCHCKRYKPALNQSSPQKCIEAIVKGGYATGPKYARHIMDLINQNNLTQYDNGQPVAPSYVKGHTYKTNVNLKIRTAPDGDRVLFDDITENAKLHSFQNDDGYAVLKEGSKVTCRSIAKQGDDIWMEIPSGYVAAYYHGKIYIS